MSACVDNITVFYWTDILYGRENDVEFNWQFNNIHTNHKINIH